ncbi:MAG: L,D-transpeptidase family protein, partial [Pseudomonadota bacterium]
NERALAARETLAAAGEAGLSAADYKVTLPQDTLSEIDDEARQRSLVEFEMNMSAAALKYVLDATRGRIDPNRLSGYHDFKRKDVDLDAALSNLAATSDVAVYLRGSSPGNHQFTVLMDELASLREADSEDHIEIAEGTFLKSGRSSAELKNIVAAMRKRGSDALLVNHGLTFAEYDISGGDLYTQELVALVKDFQKENGLAADGIIGKMTIAKLTGDSNQSKIDKIVLAMERLRWLPRDLGERHVFINQPAYRAALVDNDRDEISMRVVVGKRSNQTSFFQDEIETVEYNPYWGVPRSIIVNEMVPKLRADPAYLDRIGYQLTDRRGRRVSSTSVDWYSVGANSVPVDVRQPPGRKNALGELKILFPNKHAIYMHDTPSKNLFDRDSRAFSHGCVRLHDPRGMAAAVLGKSREHIAQQIAQGQNLAEEVENKIPVYVAYFTAWPKDDGTVGYYGDMYGRDAHLEKAIKRTSQTRGAQG